MGAVQNQMTPARRQPDIEDYIDIVRRYRSWIVGPMFGGLVVATVVAFLWPDTYVSTATLRIRPQVVSEKLAPSVVHGQMSDRLNAMAAEIMSRQSLAEIMQKPTLDLYKKERLRMPTDDVVETVMRKRIIISPISKSSGRSASSFTVSFAYNERYKAKMVVDELVRRFTDQTQTQVRNEQTRTTSYFEDEKRSAKERMDKLDQQIMQFKLKNQGRLPEQAQAMQQAMSTLQMQIMNQGSQLSNLQQEKMLLETNLKTQRTREIYEQGRLQQTETLPGQAPASVRNDYLLDLEKISAALRGQIAAKMQRLGPKHPEIVQLEAQLKSFEQQRAAALERPEPQPQSAAPVTRVYTNPEAQKALQDLSAEIEITRAQIANKQVRIDDVQRGIDQLQKQLDAYQKRLYEAPASEQQYAALQQEYTLAKMKYEEAARRRETAESAQNLTDHQGGEQLEVLDIANLPDKPSEPNRPLWAGMGVIGGLMLGLAMAAVKEVKDASLKNLKDVRAYTNLPVLSSIPLLENALLVRRKRRLVWLAWSTAILIGGVMMSGAVAAYYSFPGGA